MRSLSVLTEEHDLLKRLVHALDRAATRIEAGESVPGELLAGLVTALSQDLEDTHMAKEEHVLFPYLDAHGLPRSLAVVNALSSQHQLVRAHGQNLRKLCARFVDGDLKVRGDIVVLAREFVALFREHVRIEESYFYALADQVVSSEDDLALRTRFEAIDRATEASVRRQAARELLDRHQGIVG